MLPFMKIVLMGVVLAGSPDQLPSLSSSTLINPPDSDQNITVTCYLGNPSNMNTLGSLTVFTQVAAGPSCNSMFYDCKGYCFGCFSDFDLTEDICVDNSGRKFLR